MSRPPSPVVAAVRGAAEAVAAALDEDPLPGAVDAVLAAPLTHLVVGPVAAGKTRLLRQLLGIDAPVGLGGTTRTVTPHPDPATGATWLDSPGIDAPGRALDALLPHTGRLDTVVVVLDGLQPLTARTRTVLDALQPHAGALRAVVSRADLIPPADRPEIDERLRRAGLPWDAPPPWVDLRQPLPDALVARLTAPPARLAPWRRRTLDTALQDAATRLHAHAPPDPRVALAALRQRWRDGLPRLLELTRSERPEQVRPAASRHALALRRAVHDEAALAALGPLLGPLDLPPFPRLGEPGVLATALSGHQARVRLARRALDDWIAAVELAWVVWTGGGTALPDDQPRVRHEQAVAAVQAARAALDVSPRPPSPRGPGRRPPPGPAADPAT